MFLEGARRRFEKKVSFNSSRRSVILVGSGLAAVAGVACLPDSEQHKQNTPDAIYIGQVKVSEGASIQLKRYGESNHEAADRGARYFYDDIRGDIAIYDIPWASIKEIEGQSMEGAKGFSIENFLIDTYKDAEDKKPTLHIRVKAKVENKSGKIKDETIYIEISQKSPQVEKVGQGDLYSITKKDAGYEIDRGKGKEILPVDSLGRVTPFR